MMKVKLSPSEFKNLKGIEYFNFEEDFIEENMRCIPMVVRFKMDAAGIKLKLAEWSKFQPSERIQLALLPIFTQAETDRYHQFLIGLITKYTGNQATTMLVDPLPDWGNLHQIPSMLQKKSAEMQFQLSIKQWRKLTNIQKVYIIEIMQTRP